MVSFVQIAVYNVQYIVHALLSYTLKGKAMRYLFNIFEREIFIGLSLETYERPSSVLNIHEVKNLKTLKITPPSTLRQRRYEEHLSPL
jgi:hypothetical protein